VSANAGTKFGGGGKARAGKNSFPQPPSFLPARAKIIKSQRLDFRGKKFGFCSGQTADCTSSNLNLKIHYFLPIFLN
jgi:hypothetical protein